MEGGLGRAGPVVCRSEASAAPPASVARSRGLDGCKSRTALRRRLLCRSRRAGRGSAALFPPCVAHDSSRPRERGWEALRANRVARARLNLIYKNRFVALGAARGRAWPSGTSRTAGQAERSGFWRLEAPAAGSRHPGSVLAWPPGRLAGCKFPCW